MTNLTTRMRRPSLQHRPIIPTSLYASPVGLIAVQSIDDALVALRFVDEASTPGTPLVGSIQCWLDAYFRGEVPNFTPPLALQGTAFQQRVWTQLLAIPYGHTISYGQLARRVGCRSAQAVGQAVGHNPAALVVPCHRVVGADGSLTGYAYGLQRKQWLLYWEQCNTFKNLNNEPTSR